MSLLTNRTYRETEWGPQRGLGSAYNPGLNVKIPFVPVPQTHPSAGTPGTSSGGTAPFPWPTSPGSGPSPGMPGSTGTAAPGGTPSLWDILQMQYQPNQFPEHERTRVEAFLQKSLAPYIGQAQLTKLLLGEGRTDPAAMNQLIADTQRGTQTGQQNTQGELAQRGLGASGLGQALAAAQGEAGQNRIAGIRANEAQLAEQRKRSDLDLLLRLFIQPYQHSEDRALQQYLGERSTQGGGMGDMFGGLSSLGGVFSQLLPLLQNMNFSTGGSDVGTDTSGYGSWGGV